ncbi:hypothetical protein D3C86_1261020 [compost metagenome]
MYFLSAYFFKALQVRFHIYSARQVELQVWPDIVDRIYLVAFNNSLHEHDAPTWNSSNCTDIPFRCFFHHAIELFIPILDRSSFCIGFGQRKQNNGCMLFEDPGKVSFKVVPVFFRFGRTSYGNK